jgi:hypothetical protein
MKGSSWLAREDILLRKLYGKVPYSKIALELKRTEGATRSRAHILGLTKNGKYNSEIRWKENEICFLKENYHKLTAKELTHKIKHSVKSIHYQARRLGLSKKPSKEIMEKISLMIKKGFTSAQIENETGVSPYKTRQIIKKLGLKRKTRTGRRRTNTLLKGYKSPKNIGKESTHRDELLYTYHYTCWDCKKTFVNPSDLHIHHDITKLPVEVLVLCKPCHGKRHNVKLKLK